MEPKGIDIPGIVPNLGTNIKDLKKEAPPVKPVTKSKEGEMENLSGTEKDLKRGLESITESQVKRLADSLKEELKDVPSIEVDWEFNRDAGVLVVQIKEKGNGRVIREIPPEQLLKMLSEDPGQGLLVNKKA